SFAGRPRWVAGLAELLTRLPATIDFEHAARYVFVSDTTRRRAHQAGIRPASTGVAHSGIDPDFIDPVPEREWSWSLLYVGRLDERKGVDTAVGALSHLPDAATLTVIGGWDEDEEARLRRLAGDLGVAHRITFRGQLSREQVRAVYADVDAVIFPVPWDD